MSITHPAAVVLALFVSFIAFCEGQSVIGLNFVRGSSGDSALAEGDLAGVEEAGHWNNAPQANANLNSGFLLKSDSGALSGAVAAWDSGGTSWSVGTNGSGSAANQAMMTGYLDQSGSGDGQIHSISVTNIPYASYDVYLYHSSSGGANRTARYQANGTNIYTRNLDPANTFNGFQQAGYPTLAAAADSNNSGGNYVRWTGLSGTLTIEGEGFGDSDGGSGGDARRAPIQGIQIVDTSVISGLPEVENLNVSNVSSTSATALGNLIDNGSGSDNAALSIYWGPVDMAANTDTWQNLTVGGTRSSPGSFAIPLTGLVPNTTYFFRAFASNSAGSDLAPVTSSFTTLASLPTVQNVAASDVEGTSASLGASVTDTGGEVPLVVIHYGDDDAETGTWDEELHLGLQSGTVSGSVGDLTPGTTYFYRAAATNAAGRAWASGSASFTTPAALLPDLVLGQASGVNGTFVTFNGEVTDTGNDSPDVTIYYGTTDGGEVAGSWQFSSEAGPQDGVFSHLVTGLQANTTYFFRAFAQNAAGGVWVSAPVPTFTTPVFFPPSVVINEIHFDESDKTKRAEFIELYNPSDVAIDLSGYYFSDGIDYTFPNGTILAADEYLVVAEDPATMLVQFGVSSALGPFLSGTSLRNSGERVTLRDVAGTRVDEVDYQLGFPWPTVGAGVGEADVSPSIELIDPFLDNDLGGSWRSSGSSVSTPIDEVEEVTLVESGEVGWRYRKGTSYPAEDGSGNDWWDLGYDDAVDGAWLDGTAVIGYGDGDDTTVLSDMQNGYLSIFLRKEFTIAAGRIPAELELSCYYDDGAVVYINGVEVARLSLARGTIAFPPPTDFAINHEAVWETVVLENVESYLVEGINVIAIQCMNDRITSSDLSIDARLVATTVSSSYTPTPGAMNSVFALNAPPQIRQVSHSPVEPSSHDAVVVSARITDPSGVGSVELEYQIVEPGDYYCRYLKFNEDGSPNEDPRYLDPANWTAISMSDDGLGGDAIAGDSVYSGTIPASVQSNRRLVRYRISAEDNVGASIAVPYADDPQPNFAYFVYDGTPDWSGAIRSGDAPVTYPGSLMSSIPTYFLLSTNESVDDSQFGGYTGSEYLWAGTMVYDGEVYDHIQYRPRGGVHRFQYGKNFWKFDFTRGHRFQARDRGGELYSTSWDRLNFSSIVQQVNFGQRGEQGIFEGVGFKFFDLCGVEACRTHYVQFYVVDEASPTGANQYESDYYGLFLAIEQMNSQYLSEHDLPDGNLYKIENHIGDSNNQGPTQVADGSDVANFISGYRGQTPSAAWWEANLDIEKYLSYRAVVEGIHHYDISAGKNYFYYHNPDTDLFEVHPWDLDLTWSDDSFGAGAHDFRDKVALNPAFNTDYQNRVREIIDLLYNDDEGHRAIDEMVRDVYEPGVPSLVDADRRLWDNNPRLNHRDRYYDVAASNDFSGMVQLYKDYIDSRGEWMIENLLTQEDDIPATPVISANGQSGIPTDGLQFTSSAYDSSTAFQAMEWRISEVYNSTTANYISGEPYIYEIESPTESGELTTFDANYQFSALSARAGQTYRARVRHQDSAGRWSHWSEPLEFLALTPDVNFYANALRISEIYYHPSGTTAAERANGWEESDFEFIEIQNISSSSVDLTDVRFTKGVDFDFPAGLVIPPGAYLLVVSNQAAFESRYGTGLPIAGEWEEGDQLSNGGENLKLSLGTGTAIIEFAYGDDAPWPLEPDGEGFSLVLDVPALSSSADHSDPLAWRASRFLGGLPAAEDDVTFEDWAFVNGLGVGASLDGDPDNDGLSNWLEYAFASDPLVQSSGAQLELQEFTVDGSSSAYLTITFRRQNGASDLDYSVEVSDDLNQWQLDLAVPVSSQAIGDGTVSEVWRAQQATNEKAKLFMRVRVE